MTRAQEALADAFDEYARAMEDGKLEPDESARLFRKLTVAQNECFEAAMTVA